MSKKSKPLIVFFLPSFEGGGAERNVVNLIGGLNREKYQITLLLAQKKGVFLKRIPQNVFVVDLKASSLFGIMIKLIRYFRREKINIFISTFPKFNITNSLSKFFSKKSFNFVIIEQTTSSNLFVTAKKKSHKLIARFFLPFLMKTFYPKAQAIVCVSKAVKKDLCKFVPFSEKIRVIYNPVVENKIFELSKKEVSHPWFNNKDIPIILAVSRLVKAKDYPTLLEAFALVAKEKIVRLVILGEGDQENAIKNLSKELDILENINFLGWQENPYQYMRKASVFVSASLREGFSNAIIEAMACGAPVVCTDCAGPKEIIENGKNGMLVPVGDKKSLAKAILTVLNDSSLSQKLSEEGKKRALDFTVQKSIGKYEELFEELILKP